MKKLIIAIMMALPMMAINSASAMDTLVETVATGCESELTNYCSQVTPGEGRILACLYAHEDKLSGQCEYALYDSAAQLERFVNALSYLVNECAEDLETTCASVEAGEGRLAQCLLENKANLQKRCAAAIDATDLQVN